MNTLTALTESEVNQIVTDWYLKLDVHAPVAQMLPLLDATLTMQLPETTLHGLDEFTAWYEGVTHTFFDEVHTLQSLKITTTDDRADVSLVVRWEASRWQAPAPNSQRLAFDAAQRWAVVRSPQTHQPAIVTYIVDALTPLAGFPNL